MKFFIFLWGCFSSMAFANILFVCTGDVSRCYIAQGVGRQLLYHASEAKSLMGHAIPDEKAQIVLQAWNIQESTPVLPLDAQALSKADLVLVMTENEKVQLIQAYPQFSKKITTLSQCACGENIDIVSLNRENLKTYEKTRNQIFQLEDTISARGWVCHALDH